MPRVILLLLWIGVTVFAIADWARTPEENMPARFPRMVWLLIILITIPSFSIGALAWIIMRWVQRKEDGTQTTPGGPLFGGLGSLVSGSGDSGGSSGSGKRRFGRSSKNDSAPMAPDDDPDYLFKLERDIQRRKREAERFEAERRRKQQKTSDEEDNSDGSGNGA